ncbi:MAG TPA: Uma2 family endonuclease [Rhodospirillaceae bacterium]|nr:Uma2 family endonuclease [Rhodospirillaceae bacterium]
MAVKKLQGMSLEEFLAWEAQQDVRYELVDCQAVMMAGGSQAHSLIAANIVSALRGMLRGSPCRPGGSDLRIPIPTTGNSRYPDATIDCGEYRPDALDASEPAIVFEVLSRTTGWYDQTRKLRDYDSIPSVRQYVCVSQDEVRVSCWLRDERGNLVQQDDTTDPAGEILLSGFVSSLQVSSIYEGTGLV